LKEVGKCGGSIPLPIQLVNLEERRKLPQWGPGQITVNFNECDGSAQ